MKVFISIQTFSKFSLVVVILTLFTTSVRSENIGYIPHLDLKFDIVIDGHKNEKIWQKAAKYEFNYETRPSNNTKPHVKTFVYIFENGKSIYALFDARDDNPNQIRAHYTQRDKIAKDDFIGFMIDTFNDKTRAYAFYANALGLQMDAIESDITGTSDYSWDAIWDSAGRITENGYMVEMAIPLNRMQFPDGGAKAVGFSGLRMLPRSEQHRISTNPDDRNSVCYVCQFNTLTSFKQYKPQNSALDITPYAAYTKTELNDLLMSNQTDQQTDFGVDIKWNYNSSGTLNLTYNPDFSQVESDAIQLDINTKFSLFFEERRAFFNENSDYFDTPLNVVHTRNIASPEYGLKISGKMTKNVYGVIFATDKVTSILLPNTQSSSITQLKKSDNGLSDLSSKVAIARYRRELVGGSSIGFIYTDRSGDAYSNKVIGGDLHWKILTSHQVKAQVLRSDTEYPLEVQQKYNQAEQLEDYAYTLKYNYMSQHFWGNINYTDIGEKFRADLGFIEKVGYKGYAANTGYRWYAKQDTWWERLDMGVSYINNDDFLGNDLDHENGVFLSIKGPMRSTFRLDVKRLKQQNFDKLFSYTKNITTFEIQPTSDLIIDFSVELGEEIDYDNNRLGSIKNLDISLVWYPISKIELKASYDSLSLKSAGSIVYTARALDFKLRYQFDIRNSLRFIVQNVDIDRNISNYLNSAAREQQNNSINMQLLYTYKINPQSLIFIGYSESDYETNRQSDQDKTSVFLKIKYLFSDF